MNNQENKRLAKNTVFLYFRMLFIMGVSLYISRVVLQVLGVEDYGIYNVVGGVVAMFVFINSSMTSATQRYLTYSLGEKSLENFNKTFSSAIVIHIIIALIIIILSETIGIWLIYNKLTIPESRIDSALWVFQFSILSTVFSILTVPFNATIISHERMSAYAYISIIEATLKLLFITCLGFVTYDKLVSYGLMLFIVQVIVLSLYILYCKKYFPNVKYTRRLICKDHFLELLSFAGWSFWGNLASIASTQGVNILLNIFNGPVVNAARGLAVQVQYALVQFVSSFQTALNPQITKTYARDEMTQMHNLIYKSSRFSFYLMLLLCVPLFFETHFVLTIWLKEVPEYVEHFTRLMIIYTMISPLSNPCAIANQATGSVRYYQIVVGGLLLLNLPLSYIALKAGCQPESVFVVAILVETIAQFCRVLILRRQINLNVSELLYNIYFKVIIVLTLTAILPALINMHMSENWLRLLLVCLGSTLSLCISGYTIGLTHNERLYFKSCVMSLFDKIKYKK